MALEGSSDDARKEGNAHFVKKEYPQALGAYHSAADLDSTDYRPLWNLSAVHYELGHYDLATEYAERALVLVPDGQDVTSQKIFLRLAKAHLLLKQYDEAAKYVGKLTIGVDQEELQDAVTHAQETVSGYKKSWEKDMKSARDLPTYKPEAVNVPEYYNVGHDQANSMYDYLLEKESSDTETVAILFAGIGDSRHLLQTFVAIAQLESARPTHRKYHFTINDVKKEVFARDLIFFLLLEQLAAESQSQQREMILATLFYTYISQVMPPQVYDHLQATIESAIQGLQGGRPLPSWIKLDRKDIPAMFSALKSWKSEVIKTYSAEDFIDNALRAHQRTQLMLLQYGVTMESMEEDIPNGCAAEFKDYWKSCLLLPPSQAMAPELRSILDLPASKNRDVKIRKHLQTTWKPNVTLVDLAFIRRGGGVLDVGHNPAQLASQMYEGCKWPEPRNPKKLYDYAQKFFVSASKALTQIGDRLVVEAISGDITRVLDGIQNGLCKGRDPTYPTKYDRIHLSNIPDYVGGILFKYVFAMPMLKDKSSSFTCSTVLRNPPKFPTLEDFNNEYALLPDISSAEKVFKAKATRLDMMEGTMIPHDAAVSKYDPFSSWGYYVLQATPSTSDLSDLLSRERLEKWLYGLFLKIALPTHRPSYMDTELVYSPLNLSIFFNVLSTLYKNGYPAHWLSDVLCTILNNEVHTTARPPRSYPLRVSETKKDFPRTHIDLLPFLFELRTLTALWMAELPFGLVTPGEMPSLTEIKKYSMTFPEVNWQGETKLPVFALLFADPQAFHGNLRDIRGALLSDEKGRKDYAASNLRSSCAVITSWEWDMGTKTATFWLDEYTAKMFRHTEYGWPGMIIRTDNWSVCSLARVPYRYLETVDSWV